MTYSDERAALLSYALELVLGDGEASLKALAGRTRVVCTTVGPYARYGSKLVAACARTGTHYCDLTGEAQWMRRMIHAHQAEAEASGACLALDPLTAGGGFWTPASAMGEPLLARLQEKAGVRVSIEAG